jgi:hypothetical protein
MDKFHFKITATKEYIDDAKENILNMYKKGFSEDEIIEKKFNDFPVDWKIMIKRDLNKFFSSKKA